MTVVGLLIEVLAVAAVLGSPVAVMAVVPRRADALSAHRRHET